jgi:hypothetical protein
VGLGAWFGHRFRRPWDARDQRQGSFVLGVLFAVLVERNAAHHDASR